MLTIVRPFFCYLCILRVCMCFKSVQLSVSLFACGCIPILPAYSHGSLQAPSRFVCITLNVNVCVYTNVHLCAGVCV